MKFSRRDFIAGSSLLALGAVTGFSAKGLLKEKPEHVMPKMQEHSANIQQKFQGRIFFQNAHEFDTIAEVAERIFPEDELGAGAKKLGVGFFIDNQLASNYGSGANEYRQAPFIKGKENQGFQYSITKAELFKLGVKALDYEANKAYKKTFIELSNEQKDEILRLFESNKSEFDFQSASAKDFFQELRAMTLAGVYADPIYGGNANMQGWKMKQYPGAQMSYTAQVLSGDSFELIEPVSLSDMNH